MLTSQNVPTQCVRNRNANKREKPSNCSKTNFVLRAVKCTVSGNNS